MKVLITGGAGYLGSILSRKLLSKGHFVRVMDPLWYGKESIEPCLKDENFQLIQHDMRDLTTTVKALKDVDAVIHLASIVGMPASSIEPRTSEEINYLATKNIAELCELRDIGTYIFASTCSVYGAQPETLITEKSPTDPLDFYANQKYMSERAIGWLNHAPTILRFGTLFGYSPRMRFDLVINLFIAQALCNEKITVNGGDQFRPFLHVADAAHSIIHMLEHNGTGTFNVTYENMTIRDVAEWVSQKTGCEIEISQENLDKRNYKVSSEKIKQFGFKTSNNLETAFDEISDALKTRKISNYKDFKYHNYNFLYNSKEMQKHVFLHGI